MLFLSPLFVTGTEVLTRILNSKHSSQIKLITIPAIRIVGETKLEKTNSKERIFSVEPKSEQILKNVSLTNELNESVFVEGTLGELIHASFTEGIILEVVGANRTLRVDLGEGEIKKIVSQKQVEARER